MGPWYSGFVRTIFAISLLFTACTPGAIGPSVRDVGSASAPDAAAADAASTDTDPRDASTDADVGFADAAAMDAAAEDAQVAEDGGFPADPLMGVGAVTAIDTRFDFTEGPVWRPAEGDLLFSDIPANTIYRRTEARIVSFRMPSQNSNGLALDTQGRLLAAEHGARRVSRTLADGTVETVVDRFEGLRLNSPNDLAVRQDGTIYFTDPPYGINDSQRELDFMGVFRVAPDGALSAEWRGPLSARPNGIALSPDQTVLYVAYTTEQLVRRFEVAADGSLGTPTTFANTDENADGMAVDLAGNLYVTVAPGVEVFAPDGTRRGLIATPQAAANCAFGGADRRTLFITARSGLYQVRVPIPGLL